MTVSPPPPADDQAAPELYWSASAAKLNPGLLSGLFYSTLDGKYVTPSVLPEDAVRLVPAPAVAVPAETRDDEREIEPYPDPDCPNCAMDHGSLSDDPDWYHASDCPRLGTDAQFGPPWPPFEGPAMTEGTS